MQSRRIQELFAWSIRGCCALKRDLNTLVPNPNELNLTNLQINLVMLFKENRDEMRLKIWCYSNIIYRFIYEVYWSFIMKL